MWFFIIGIGLLLTWVAACIVDRLDRKMFIDWDYIKVPAFILGGLVVSVALIMLPLSQYKSHIKSVQIEQARSMIENRYEVSEAERATLYGQMIEYNMDIVGYQESNGSPWLGWFISDEVDSIELLK